MARIITKGLIGVQDLNLGTGTFSRSTSTGGTQTLNQINGSNIGLLIVPPVTLLAQAASIGSTLLYAVPSTGAGIYRLSTHIQIATANASSDVLISEITTNNGYIAQTFVTGTIDMKLTSGSEFNDVRVFYSAASQNINYLTSVTSALGTGVYELRLRLEYLG